MIKKTEKLVITFYTTTAAMAMEQICKECGAEGADHPGAGQHLRRLRFGLVRK